jgi:hypothetical protein
MKRLIPHQPQPEPDQLPPIILDDSYKEWFMTVLEEMGFPEISEKVDNDETPEWFTRMFMTILDLTTKQHHILQVIHEQQLQQQQPQPGSVAVVEQDRRLVLPGDPGFQT